MSIVTHNIVFFKENQQMFYISYHQITMHLVCSFRFVFMYVMSSNVFLNLFAFLE